MKKIVIALLFAVSSIFCSSFCFENGTHNEPINIEEDDFSVSKMSDEEVNELNYQISQEQDFCIFNCYVPEYTADGWEKNDTLNTASNVGSAVPIGFTSLWNGTLHDVSETTYDVDYYKFTLNTDRQIKVELKNIPSGTNYNIKLYKVSGFFLNVFTLIGESSNSSNYNESITTSIQESGTYIVLVYSVSGLSSSPYTIYLSALYPLQSVAYKVFNLNLGTYEYRIVKFTPDFSVSATAAYHTLHYCYFIPYEILYNIYQFALEGSPLSMTNNTLGLSSEEELFLEISLETIIGSLVGLVIEHYASGPLGTIITSISLYNAILDLITYFEDKSEFYAAFDYAIANHTGMYYLYESEVTSGDVHLYFNDYEFGRILNQYYAYNIFTKNVSTSWYVDYVGTLNIERTIHF
ncbi:MAG: pre-peptidase C-terminal domain-containing protein [Bacilli bacterium]|nr:pre-peptidase C-terminal domain-containing protein [Bacilli bacterium]